MIGSREGSLSMKVTTVARPGPVSHAIDQKITSDITTALQQVRTVGSTFIVNDTPWYAVTDRAKVTPCVMNSAKFISGQFLKNLTAFGWSREKEIVEQKIDAYISIPESGQAFRISSDKFLHFFEEYLTTPEGHNAAQEAGALNRLFSRLYESFVSRPFVHPGQMSAVLQKHAQPVPESVTVRVGLEFETGNIASSFRSLYKLGFLYNEGEIDAGVFITSIDKNSCATRIWPASNRNGSFQELQQRNYKRMVVLPLWEFGFAPDGFSSTAGYLGSDGNLYVPSATKSSHLYNSVAYDVYVGEREKKVLKRVQPLLPPGTP